VTRTSYCARRRQARVLFPHGRVTTTFIAAWKLSTRPREPIGSLTSWVVRLGKRTEGRAQSRISFPRQYERSGDRLLDIYEDNAYDRRSGRRARNGLLDQVKERCRHPAMKAVFDQTSSRNQRPNNQVRRKNGLRRDGDGYIRQFQKRTGVARTTMICAVDEVFHEPPRFTPFERFRVRCTTTIRNLAQPDLRLCRAEVRVSTPTARPPQCDTSGSAGVARDMNLPVSGKDYKSGQTS